MWRIEAQPSHCPVHSNVIADRIRRAREGDGAALGELLEQYRGWLKLMAARDIDPRAGRRVDASDVVQQTCLSVHRRITEFDGETPAQFLAWLQKIHQHNVQDAGRDQIHAQKRSTDREEYTTNPGGILEGHTSTPSQRLMRDEEAVRLASLLDELTEDQREAVRLRFLEGHKLGEIAEQMERTEAAVAALIQRGLVALRHHLRDEEAPHG